MNVKTNSKTAALTLLAAAVCLLLFACAPPEPTVEQTGQIYLYGEIHGVVAMYETEFELWSDYYHNRGMRHLFVEYPYFEAEYLNLWMRTGSDEIWNILCESFAGTYYANSDYLNLLKRIKEECPETVFHGTDIGLGYWITGERFLEYLESAGQTDTEQYRLAQENVEQGKRFYDENMNDVYRENKMAENFLREVEGLDGADIMGIYGLGHVEDTMTQWAEESIPNMAAQLRETYGEDLHTEAVAALVEPCRTETITMGGKEYTAQYFGKKYDPHDPDFQYAEYWRLEDAYDDCKDKRKTYDYASYNGWPVKVEDGQVFAVAYTRADGSVIREFYRADGRVLGNVMMLDRFDPEA